MFMERSEPLLVLVPQAEEPVALPIMPASLLAVW